ncbi:MAG: hypothetical protein JO138_25400 [Acidobacteriaceae bacterium]|nr:hypothetical protein [Acidobacteriaceae bacterium]
MNAVSQKRTRRDFVKAIGGTLAGVSLLATGRARGQALGSLPSGYRFYRVLTAGQGGSIGGLPNNLGAMTGSVMMASPLSGAGQAYIYLHGRHLNTGAPALFRININYDQTPPAVSRVWAEAYEGGLLAGTGNVYADHIGVGASNALGEYVTTILPQNSQNPNTAPAVYLLTPGSTIGSWRRLIRFGDDAPDGSLYGGDFGDIALDDSENMLLVAATTQAPASFQQAFSGSQALISTSVSGASQARVVLRTGDALPYTSAAIQSVGLVDLAANNAFAAQVTGHLPHAGPYSGTALIAGDTQARTSGLRLVAACPTVLTANSASLLHVSSGNTYLGARVDPQQDVTFVTHLSLFDASIGSNGLEELGYFSERSYRLGQTQPLATNEEVLSYNAPCIGNTGLVYVTQLLGDGTNQLIVSDGANSNVLLQSGDKIPGVSPGGDLTITEIFFGQHATQVDAFGRLAFTAEFAIDPNNLRDPNNFITALVIGIPL